MKGHFENASFWGHIPVTTNQRLSRKKYRKEQQLLRTNMHSHIDFLRRVRILQINISHFKPKFESGSLFF